MGGKRSIDNVINEIKILKEKYGFLKCEGRVELLFFHKSECEENVDVGVGDEVEFDISIDSRKKQKCATRLAKVERGSSRCMGWAGRF